jgi:acetyl-CoA carboxylase carboxyltransferase component
VFPTAEIGGVEEIIDPRDTRRLLGEWLDLMWRKLPNDLGKKARGMRP